MDAASNSYISFRDVLQLWKNFVFSSHCLLQSQGRLLSRDQAECLKEARDSGLRGGDVLVAILRKIPATSSCNLLHPTLKTLSTPPKISKTRIRNPT